jgi:hypothetical protein
MRYRPLGNTGMAISAISVTLNDQTQRRAQDWIPLVYAGLENGINAYEVAGLHPQLIEGFADAIRAVDRNLLFIAWRFGWVTTPNGPPARDFSAEALSAAVTGVLARTGLEYIDAAILDDPTTTELPPAGLEAMKQAKEAGQIRMLGVSGNDEATDAYISTGEFDLLLTPFHLLSGWKERLRLKAAIERDMAVVGCNFHPDIARDRGPKQPLWGRGNVHPLSGVGSYGFLDDTPKWSAEELCLAYALTEPSLCSIEISGDRIERIEQLAAISERELPANVPAQIEMARFTPGPGAVETDVALDRRRQAS